MMHNKKHTTFKLNSVQKKSRKKRFILLLVTAVFLTGAIGTYVIFANKKDTLTSPQNIISRENDAKSSNDRSSKEDSIKNPLESTDPEKLPVSKKLSFSEITSDQQNGLVTVSASISGTDTDTDTQGYCTFSFSAPESRPVVRRVNRSGNPAVCSSSIPEVEFDRLGTWNVDVTFYTSDNKITSSKEIVIQ